MRAPFLLLLTSCALAACVATTEQSTHTIATRLANELEQNYLFPDIGKEYAAYLRTNEGLLSDSSSDPRAYANSLTKQLQAIHPDGHLRVHYEPDATEESETPARSNPARTRAIDEAAAMLPGIAYLRMNLFPGNQQTLKELNAFIKAQANSENLIIDLRGHRGGGLAEMDVLFSNLFPARTNLVQMDVRQAVDDTGQSPIKDTKTTIRIAGPEGVVRRQHVAIPIQLPSFADASVYVLTSNYTVSAAEHLAFALQKAKRATIIGEATYGGAHFGGDVNLGDDFYAFIPVGRTFDPESGESWEESGVRPDIEVKADAALIQALLQIGVDRDLAIAADNDVDFDIPTRKRLGG